MKAYESTAPEADWDDSELKVMVMAALAPAGRIVAPEVALRHSIVQGPVPAMEQDSVDPIAASPVPVADVTAAAAAAGMFMSISTIPAFPSGFVTDTPLVIPV